MYMSMVHPGGCGVKPNLGLGWQDVTYHLTLMR